MNRPPSPDQLAAAAQEPNLFLGVIIETNEIAERANSIRRRTSILASAVAQSVEQRSVALLKAAINANDNVGFELQRDVDRLRGLITALDRKLAAHQVRRPRA